MREKMWKREKHRLQETTFRKKSKRDSRVTDEGSLMLTRSEILHQVIEAKGCPGNCRANCRMLTRSERNPAQSGATQKSSRQISRIRHRISEHVMNLNILKGIQARDESLGMNQISIKKMKQRKSLTINSKESKIGQK